MRAVDVERDPARVGDGQVQHATPHGHARMDGRFHTHRVPLALRIPPAGSPQLTCGTNFRIVFVPLFGLIFDVVFGPKIDHFWNPTCAQMSPNDHPQMCLHNDVSKNRFSVIICPMFDLFNARR